MTAGGNDDGGGGASRPLPPDPAAGVVLYEEQAQPDARWEGIGTARIGRRVETRRVSEEFERRVEEMATERVPVGPDDSGQIETLPDGSISIPLYEEQLVVTRRTILRERVVVRKATVRAVETVEAELRSEHVSIDTGELPEDSVEVDDM